MNWLAKMFFILAIGIFSMGVGKSDIKYQVKKGDNLFKIGKKFGVPHEQIMARNGLDRTMIFPNQQLFIPSSATNTNSTVSVGQSDSRITEPRKRSDSRAENIHSSYVLPPVVEDLTSPFASARKLPEAKSVAVVESWLGEGYQPSPYKNPPIFQREMEPQVIAHKIPLQVATNPITQDVGQRPQLAAKAPESKGLLRSREVAAVAHYPGLESNHAVLNPIYFPTPSFSNPSKPFAEPSKVPPVRIYTVCDGDSVNSISRKFKVGGLSLRRENNIMFSKVYPGMQLRIPD